MFRSFAGLPCRSSAKHNVGGCRIMVVQGSPKPLAGVRFPPPVQTKSQLILAVIFGMGGGWLELNR